MADDVKVKFGGDFSDIAKGAGAAAKVAGNAMGTSISNFANGLQGSITSALSIENIFSKISEKIDQSREYFKDLNRGIKVTGVSAEEFQDVLQLGKGQGVGIETITKGLGIFAKNISAAAKGSAPMLAVLKDLDLASDAATASTVTATQALEALAKQSEGPKASHVADNLAKLFGGKSGKELMPIIKAGSAFIAEGVKGSQTFKGSEIEVVAAAARERERKEKKFDKFFRSGEVTESYGLAHKVISDSIRETVTDFEKAGKKDVNKDSEEFVNAYINKLIGKGMTPKAAAETMKHPELNMGFAMPGPYSYGTGFGERLEKELESRIKKAAAESLPEIPDSRIALTASSIQAIGGGDVNSVMAASYQAEMLSTTQSIDASMKRLVENNPFGPAQPPAKAGR
jgi:hypothetical protein